MALKDIQKIVQSPTLRDDMEVIRPEVKRAMEADQAAMQGQRLAPPPIMANIPPELRKLETEAARQIEQPVDTWDGGVGSLHEMLFTPSPYIGNDSLASLAIKPFVEKEIDKAKEERLNPLQDIGRKALGFNPEDEVRLANTGGLMGMAAGGRFDGRVPGQGHGMQDNVYMPIKEEGQQVATLAVSPKEYVVDAHTMSAIGNGNADAGADVMDKVVESIREKAYGTDQQPNEINGLAALRPMIERV